jgi:hypothetical protein
MNIELAEVQDNSDIIESGAFYVSNGNRDFVFKVHYVSPYLAGDQGGFIAIPEVGSRVLVCQPTGENEWYYLGSTTKFGLGGAIADAGNAKKGRRVLADRKIYKARGLPQRVVWKTPKGNALILSDEYNSDYFDLKAELRTGSGKSIRLVDSPKVDCIIIENEHGDKIKISSTSNDATAPRSIELECKGTINIITRESSLNLQVIDGKELNIINNSSGSKRSGPNDPTPGNINIVSEQGDVNITTKSDTGSIFLDTKGANSHIVLKSKGQIDIKGDKGVYIDGNPGKTEIKGSEIHLN